MRIQSTKIVVLLLLTASLVFAACNVAKTLPPKRMVAVEKPSKDTTQLPIFENYFLEGQRLKFSNQPDSAFKMFNRCLQMDSTSAVVYYELSDLFLKKNNPVSAIDCARKATQLDSGNYWYLYLYANLAQNLKMEDEAERAFVKLTTNYPEKPELNYALVELYTQKKEFKKAIAILDKLEQQLGLSEEISIEKFRLYSHLQETKSAFAEIEKLVAAFPNDIRYRILLGDMCLENNQLPAAYDNFQFAKTIEPSNANLAVSLANYYEKTGDQKLADLQIKSALSNPKTEVETKNRILSSYIASHISNPLEAEVIKSLFDSLMVMHPQEDSFYQMYADYLMAQKKPLEARAKLLTAIEIAPTNPISWKQLLNVNLNLTDYKAVIETCDKAIANFPEASEFYFYKGMGNFLSDNFEKAIQSYQKGLLLVDSKNGALLSDFYGQIGDVYQRIGKISLAYEAYDNALKHNEKNIVVLNNYAYYLSIEKKDLRKAEAMSGKCIAIDPNNSTYLDTYAWIYFVQQNFTLAKFYIEQALKSGGDKNEVVVEHYGDILFVSGEIEKGLEQWNLSKQMGNTSDTLRKKIEQKVFIDEPVK